MKFKFRIKNKENTTSMHVNFEQNPISGGRDITEKVNVDVLMLDIYLGFMGAPPLSGEPL